MLCGISLQSVSPHHAGQCLNLRRLKFGMKVGCV